MPRILVIDDEQGFRELLSYDLGNRGFYVTTAGDGEEGTRLAQSQKFDVVVTDLTMPNMGGLEALEEIKEFDSKIEVIIVTGFATIETAVNSIKRGAYDYITKPFEIDNLVRLIERAGERRRLNLQVDQLQDLNRFKSEFLANMSHELRTPLNAIMGYTGLVLEGTYGRISEESQQALTRVATNSKNLLQLINNILDLSKLTAARMPVFIENCRLRDVAKEVVDTLGVLAAEKKLTLSVEADEDFCIASDKTKIKQVLINLVGNGIKFTSEGHVSIKMSRPAETSEVEIQVKDTGPGIRPEDIPLLFEEFKQLDSSSTRAHGGTGLGLCISKKLVELLGGTIRVESVPGSGSAFIVTLPVDNRRSEVESIPPIPRDINGSTEKILLAIDDDPEALKLIKDSIKGSGFRFVGAQTGEEGLAMAREIRPTVITLDIMMPHLDGWSVLQLIKNDPGLAPIPVIVLSIMENKALGFSLGVADYIVKPFERQAFLETLRSLDVKKQSAKDTSYEQNSHR